MKNFRSSKKQYIREKGCDHLQVGWYTSSLHSEMFTKFFFSTLLNYQVENFFAKNSNIQNI